MSDAPKIPTIRESLARLSANGLIACLPPQHIAASLGRREPGEGLETVLINAMTAERITPAQERAIAKKDGAIAIIPVRGVIVPREDRYSGFFGEVGAENTAERVRSAVADQRVKAVVLDIDSPGGNVQGVTEAHNTIRALRGKKPIVAHADWYMASAAYWIGCAADEIVASPSASVGAVGILAASFDETKALELAGVKATPYAKPDDKADGWGMWPNSDKFDARMKADVAETYAQFVNDIASARTVDRQAVLDDWAFAYVARKAKALGMVDKIRPMQETFAAYTAQNSGMSAATFRNRLALLKLKGNQLPC